MAELRQMIAEEISHPASLNYVPATDRGIRLMKRFARYMKELGYRFVPEFYDSVDAVTWPVVLHDGKKAVFEYEDEIYVLDSGHGWLIVDENDLEHALNGLAMDLNSRHVGKREAYITFWDEVRLDAFMG